MKLHRKLPHSYEWEYANDEVSIYLRVTLHRPEQEQEQESAAPGASMIQQPLFEGPLVPTVAA